MNINTNMGTTVYWHKNQFLTRLKLKGSVAPLTVEQIAQDPIKFVLNNYLPASIDVQCIDVHHLPQLDSDGNTDFVFCHRINLKTQSNPDMELMQGNGAAAGM